jgi:hypothetical protein
MEQAARCSEEGATANEAETTVVQKGGFHGATFTDIRANVSPWGICLPLGVTWVCRLLCCAGQLPIYPPGVLGAGFGAGFTLEL